MAKSNSGIKNRSIFSSANKYQDKIILLTFLPSFLIFAFFISIVFIGNPIISKAVFHTTFTNTARLINTFSELIVFLICSVFLISLIITFKVSRDMVGGIGRIIRELDEVIAGQSKRTITCRPHDDLTKELLKRINVLIGDYVEHKKQK